MQKIKSIVICSLFCALICVGAFIRIPLPELSITMQLFFVLLAGLVLDGKMAFLSVLVYILLGLLGLPVFSAGGGLSYVLKPSFGYLLGFAVAAGTMGIICRKDSELWRMIAATVAGIFIIYTFGISYYILISELVLNISLSPEFIATFCILTVLPGDIISAILAVVLAGKIKKNIIYT